MLTTCPKSMEYGPCGGVEFDGTCEVSPHPCVFLDVATVRWHGIAPAEITERVTSDQDVVARAPFPAADPVPPVIPSAGGERMRELIATRPIVVADFPARALDAASIAECGAILSGRVDAVLAGDAGSARVQFPPAYRASLILAAGLTPWTGFNCRDRNRVAMEGELAALAHAGVGAVHCVTGDHTLTGSRPDAVPVFDLDSTEAASLARAAGHLVSVGESPATPPVGRRADRLLQKAAAGAEVCFVNHAGGVQPVREFIARAHDIGVTLDYIACIPIVVDRASAELLRSFTSLALPPGYLERILGAADPFEEGIAAAVELAHGMLALDSVAGVNLSGGAGAGREAWFAEALGRIADGIGVTTR
ncbi:methylenetetrahydrofolate reductase C-terminal domain-containing protein [Galbitalea soli]|uniref:Methylenetetrahydrofolate reductase n=1 Tax=Galbitalea soli TaxID=1268042 RepID=A0A7C9PN54_9MICO|nr:methylenetetrahydrofolate reductase C-terminal domain-containing protein [Galbitalea soli]NEM91434.1 methylenetetrahydrofolate reductase [Galbitalea soli]NYJ30127.1 5,10-methylenetetrahydrofolate reductase [Galbitalea soli]